MGREESGMEQKCSVHHVLLQPEPTAAHLRDGSGSHDPVLTVSFIRKELFKPNLKKQRRCLSAELTLGDGSCRLCLPFWALITQDIVCEKKDFKFIGEI